MPAVITFDQPPHGKTNNLHKRLFFTTQKVQSFVLNLKFQASSFLLGLYSLVCVGPVRKSHCWFSHEAAHLLLLQSHVVVLMKSARHCLLVEASKISSCPEENLILSDKCLTKFVKIAV